MWFTNCCLFVTCLSVVACLQDLSESTVEDSTIEDGLVDDIGSECGVISEPSGLIQGGNFSRRHEFPWIAIISVEENGLKSHKGSGSLVSKRHVVVKARAVSTLDDQRNWIAVDPKHVEIHLGMTMFNEIADKGSLRVGVSRIQNYPNAKKVSSSFSIFNFAVITLDQDVTFNEFIKPICLWSFDSDFENEIVGKVTYAVGYGVDKNGHVSLTRKHVSSTITDDKACQSNYKTELEQAKDSKFFCILGAGDGPCHYDSQLYMKVQSTWYLKGILCSARMYLGFRVCAVSYPILVEDILPFVDWISEQIKEDSE